MGLFGAIAGGLLGGPVGAIAGGVLGSKVGGAGKVKTPGARSYEGELTNTLKTQRGIAKDLFGAEEEYRPKYAGLDSGIVRELFGGGEMFQQAATGLQEAENQAQARAAAGDIGIAGAFGPDAYRALMQSSPLLAQLNQQASSELGAGYGLEPNYKRQLQQDFRAGSAARGFGYSPRDAALEAYTLGRAGSTERRASQNFAMGVDRTNQSGIQNLLFGPAVGTSQMIQGLGYTSSFLPGQIFNPESAYAGSLYGNQYNAQANALAQTANNRAGLTGGLLSGAALLGGAYLGG